MAYSCSLSGSSVLVLLLGLACSGSFDATGSGGSTGFAGAAQAGDGSSVGGGTSSAGTSSAGTSSAGTSSAGTSSAGTSSAGTSSGGASGSTEVGGASSAGAGGSPIGSGGFGAGAGGALAVAGSSGSSAGAGGTGGADCVTLKAEYSAALQKARVCDAGSTDECSSSSTLPAIGCGCPTLVNAKSADTALAKKRYDAVLGAKCNMGAMCNIACLALNSAACAVQVSTSGSTYVCSSRAAIPN